MEFTFGTIYPVSQSQYFYTTSVQYSVFATSIATSVNTVCVLYNALPLLQSWLLQESIQRKIAKAFGVNGICEYPGSGGH